MEPLAPSLQPSTLKQSPSVGVRIGVDLGQKADHTAIVIVELQCRDRQPNDVLPISGGVTHFVVRTLHRMELGVTYPVIARRLVAIDDRLRADGWYPDIYVDATGLGVPVVELLRESGLPLTAVYVNGSDQVVKGERRELRLGKSLLVSRLQVLLQTGRIHLPNTPDATLLIEELLNYEIRVNDNAHSQFGVFTMGRHDDLVTAMALACWEDGGYDPSFTVRPVKDTWDEPDEDDRAYDPAKDVHWDRW